MQNLRLNLQVFDPRPLVYSQENLELALGYLNKAASQLEEDHLHSLENPDDNFARDAQFESLTYLNILKNWVSEAKSKYHLSISSRQSRRTNNCTLPCAETFEAASESPVCASPQCISPQFSGERVGLESVPMEMGQEGFCLSQDSVEEFPQNKRCLFNIDRGSCYVQVQKLRDTIYGNVRLYQVGDLQMRFGNKITVMTSKNEGLVAVKSYDIEKVQNRRSREGHRVQEDPLKELAIQRQLNQPGNKHVLQLLLCMRTSTRFYAFYPYVKGGELFDYVCNRGSVDEESARVIMKGMTEAIKYCHSAGVCHRDISLENFLLSDTESLEPLLIDFGLSVIMEKNEQGEWKRIPHTGSVGKIYYMAPEVFANNGVAYDGPKVDVWSLGVTLLTMLTGVPLWKRPEEQDERFRACRKDLAKMLKIWKFNLSPCVVDLVQRMLRVDPNERISLDEVLGHEWLSP